MLRDHLWLWGQTPNSHHANDLYKLPGVNHMTPLEGCAFFDIPNICRVVMGTPVPPFDDESRLLTGLRQVVWYDLEIDADVREHLSQCDVITYWTWNGSNIARLESFLDRMIEATPGKRRLAGCYMWNYGECRPLTDAEMLRQLEVYLAYIRAGQLEGIVLCSNCIADIGLSAVALTRAWIQEHKEGVFVSGSCSLRGAS